MVRGMGICFRTEIRTVNNATHASARSGGAKIMIISRPSRPTGATRALSLTSVFRRRTRVLVPILLLALLLTACGTFKIEARLMRPEEAAALVQTSSRAPMPAPSPIVGGSDSDRIVLEQPSRQLPSLREALQQAKFPLYISTVGELWRVSTIGAGREFTHSFWTTDSTTGVDSSSARRSLPTTPIGGKRAKSSKGG